MYMYIYMYIRSPHQSFLLARNPNATAKRNLQARVPTP